MHSNLYCHQLRLFFKSSFSSDILNFINSTAGLLLFAVDEYGSLSVKGIGKFIRFLVSSNSIYDIHMRELSWWWLGLIMVENRIGQVSSLRSEGL